MSSFDLVEIHQIANKPTSEPDRKLTPDRSPQHHREIEEMFWITLFYIQESSQTSNFILGNISLLLYSIEELFYVALRSTRQVTLGELVLQSDDSWDERI